VKDLAEKKISEISCPLCKKRFHTKIDKPRTKDQWKISLMVHLIASPHPGLKLEEVESIVNSYIASL